MHSQTVCVSECVCVCECDTALIAHVCCRLSLYMYSPTTEIGNPKRAHASKMSIRNRIEKPSLLMMMLTRFMWLGLGLAGMWLPLVAGGSCREAQLCCNGRDSSCVVQKAPINAIIEDLSDKPCYCDHACLKLGDCCDDFKDHCGGEYDQKI